MSNKKYGSLTALRFVGNGKNGAKWECRCDCGKKKIVDGYLLRRGSVKTCGCGIGLKNNFIGKRFGRLMIVGKDGVANDRNLLWKYKCDCGNEGTIKSKGILHGVKSCGCLRKIEKGEANFNKLYLGYKNSAQGRELIFSLSKNDFRKIIGKKCFYCGIEPKQKLNRKFSNGEYLFNGIDRKDNTKGYTIKNSLPCCFVCNRAKGNMEYKDFILWIKTIKKKRF